MVEVNTLLLCLCSIIILVSHNTYVHVCYFAAVDYSGLPFNLTFENCNTKCGNISIKDDSIVELKETFTITLINYTDLILDPETAVISILDDGTYSISMYSVYIWACVEFTFRCSCDWI